MKKIAFLILILFTVVQVLPTIKSLWENDQAIVLDISEETKIEKYDAKASKEFLPFYIMSLDLSVDLNTMAHLTERIMPSPFFEKLIPPPNFC